jgi:ELWxxDGT repeat protein
MSVHSVRRLAPALIVLLSAAMAGAQGRPIQVLDLNTTVAGAGVASAFTRIGEVAYFAGHGLDEGVELWRTDGTEAGTFLAVDIAPGPESSSPQCMTVLGSTLYFSANDGVHGPELWTSDGTPAGTHMVVDALPGPEGVSPCQIVQSGELVFFARLPWHASGALWRTDGTEAGTFELGRGRVLELTPFNGEVYFASDDNDHGRELYASDGTLLGTRRVADLAPGTEDSDPRSFVAAPAGLVFRAGGFWDSRFWITDGTEAGTAPLPSPQWVCGDPSRVGDEIWLGGFEGDQCGVWRTDGTAEGTELLFTVGEDTEIISPFALAWDQLAVEVYDWDEDEIELRRIDPAGESVSILRGEAGCGGGFGIRDLTPFDGDLFFAGFAEPGGWTLHRSDGTTAGTVDFGPVFPGWRGSNPSNLTPLGDRLLFAAQDVEHGFEPWVTDGTVEGTHPLRDIHLGNSRGVGRIANVAGSVFLQATRLPTWEVGNTELGGSIQRPELWQTDGSAPGTGPVPWSDAVEWAGLPIATDGALTLFVGRNTGELFGLWATDGTAAGTRRLIDVSPYILGDEWGRMVGGRWFLAVGGRAYLSDGTPEGTQEIPFAYSSSESQAAKVGDELLFVSEGRLWLTDGTVSGTRPLGISGLFVAWESSLAALGDQAFFFGSSSL